MKAKHTSVSNGPGRLVRRRRTPAAALLSLALVLSACGGGVEADDGGPGGGGALADTVEIGTAVIDDAVNPLNEQYSTFQFAAFDNLLRTLPNVDPEPRIATEWERVSDTVMSFTLRPGVTFHDGSPVTAEDIKFSFDTTLAEGFANSTNLDTLAEVRVVNESTIEIETTAPDPLLLEKVAQIFIIPMAYWQKVGGADAFSAAPVGSGPYMIESFSPEKSMEFVAYDGFWGEAPVTKNVSLRYFSDPQALQSSLESGQIDAAHNLPASAVQTLKGNSDFIVETPFGGVTNMLQMNTTVAPFDDARVRQAANMAIDQKALIAALTFGVGRPENGQVTYEGVTGYNPSVTSREFDVEAAKKLIQEAGAEGAEVVVSGLSLYSSMLEAVAGGLTDIGLSVTVESTEIGPWVEEFRNGSDANIFYRGSSYTGVFDATRAYRWFTATALPFVVDPEWDALMAKQATELDPEVRSGLLEDATEYVRENDFVLFTYGTVAPGARLKAVEGLDFSNGLMVLIEDVSKKA